MRTPLFRLLRRVIRDLRQAEQTGVPVAEIRDRRIHRRQILQGAAVGILGLAGARTLSACSSDSTTSSTSSDLDIAIVGGGLAGLHCAYRLQKAGVASRVYEASKSWGGRVQTDRDTFGPQICEIGGELIDTGHQTMHDLCTELGIDLVDYDNDTGVAKQTVIIGAERLADDALADRMAPLLAKIDDALKVLTDPDAGVTYANPNGGAALDAMTIAQWLDQAGYTSGFERAFLEAAYVTEYGLELDNSSALNLLLLVGNTDKFAVFGESDERFHTTTGNHTVVEKLAAALPASSLLTEHKLVKLARQSDGRYVLTFEQASAQRIDVVARRVVLAVPFTTLRDVEIAPGLLPDRKLAAIRDYGYGANCKLMVGFSSRPWRTVGMSAGETFVNLGYQSTWETSRLQAGDAGIITNFTGGKHALDVAAKGKDAALAEFLDQFDQVFPGSKAASNGKALLADWPNNPLVKASYCSPLPGQYTLYVGDVGTAVDGIHFAGEHTSVDYIGYMEGAAESGARVADELLADKKTA